MLIRFSPDSMFYNCPLSEEQLRQTIFSRIDPKYHHVPGLGHAITQYIQCIKKLFIDAAHHGRSWSCEHNLSEIIQVEIPPQYEEALKKAEAEALRQAQILAQQEAQRIEAQRQAELQAQRAEAQRQINLQAQQAEARRQEMFRAQQQVQRAEEQHQALIRSQQIEAQRQASALLASLQVTGAQRVAAIRAQAQAAAKQKAAELQMEEARQALERKRQYLEEESRAQDGIRRTQEGSIPHIAGYERSLLCALKDLEEAKAHEAKMKGTYPPGHAQVNAAINCIMGKENVVRAFRYHLQQAKENSQFSIEHLQKMAAHTASSRANYEEMHKKEIQARAIEVAKQAKQMEEELVAQELENQKEEARIAHAQREAELLRIQQEEARRQATIRAQQEAQRQEVIRVQQEVPRQTLLSQASVARQAILDESTADFSELMRIATEQRAPLTFFESQRLSARSQANQALFDEMDQLDAAPYGDQSATAARSTGRVEYVTQMQSLK